MTRRLIACAGLAAGLLTTTALAETWNMATPCPDSTFHTENIKQFAEEIDQATNGELKITVHSNASLFKHPQIKRASADWSGPGRGSIYVAAWQRGSGVCRGLHSPLVATDYAQAKKLWEVSRPHVDERLAGEKLVLLYAVPWPPQGLYTSKPVSSVADLEGRKFRAYNNTTSQLAVLTGMVPTQVEVPEIPQAFATGIVDAMVTSHTTRNT